MDGWTDAAHGFSSIHREGHRVSFFEGCGWWFYPSGYRGPRQPGPVPAGPFKSLDEAKAALPAGQLPHPLMLQVPYEARRARHG